jgi:hypothetical protein
MATNNNQEVTGWVGWVYFAGFMLVLTGIFQTIAGLTALLNDEFYLLLERQLVVFDFTTWGWIHMLLGIVIICAGTALFSGKKWARIVGVILATLNFIAQFAWVQAYPIWSIIAMVLDILVIYALTVHGHEAAVDAE